MIVSRHVVFDEDSFSLAASPSLTDLNFLCEFGPTVFIIETHLTTAGTSTPAPRRPAPEIPPGFEPPVAHLPALTVPPGFLPHAATRAAPPTVTDSPPPRTWSASPVTYIRWEVGADAAGTRSAPGAALRREVGARATGTCGTPGAAPCWEADAGATGIRGSPGAAMSREVGAGAVETRGAPGAALRRAVGAGATGTRGAPGATLSREVGAGATGTRGAPGATLSREVGTAAMGTHGALRAALSQEAGTTPLSPIPHPSASGQGMVVPVTPPDNSHRMITRDKTGFRVVSDCLVDPLLRSCYAYRSPLACGSGGRVWNPDQQWDLGAGSPTSGLQRCHWQVGLHAQASC
jgi:hypothetical protein